VFTFALLEALHQKYRVLRQEGGDGTSVPEQHKSQLEFLDKRGAAYLMLYAVSQSMETIIGRSIPNKFKLRFSENVTPEHGTSLWNPVLEVTLPLSRQLDDCFAKNRVVNDKLRDTVSKFAGLIASLSMAHRPTFEMFRSKIEIAA
jgi:hypothetical protein